MSLFIDNVELSLGIQDIFRESYKNLYVRLCSLLNSKRAIELELLRIIMQNSWLDILISAQSDNTKLMNTLSLFMQIFHQNIEDIITGSEKFSGEMFTPRNQVSLPNSIYELLVKYYNDTYDWNFVSIADIASSNLSLENSNQSIIVLPIVIQFSRIQIAAKIFGSKYAPRYQRSSYILAKFIQDDEIIDIFSGHVQYYFEHTVQLPTGPKTH
ncbi:hypothetical protein GLOIN_2v415082 [Rhizophagus clarus]|uniref:Uncharacterized protein n=1 Tax=Rhizophagus clarus TaxID=94130 RepID=A0A8H3QLQ9_9GLOM|nr:hypothetical protein GLOIN_2v415082 [Rhizophagus clarus]